jgi:quercetin dioxygenase-like cupin family protein
MQPQTHIVRSSEVSPLNVLGTEVRFLCEARRTGGAWSLMEVTLPLDAGPPRHTHRWDEAYFVIEGEAEFTIGERRHTATAGDFLYTPGGVVHGFRGASPRPARVLIFDAPAHAGAFFERVDREVTDLRGTCPRCSPSARAPASISSAKRSLSAGSGGAPPSWT